MCITMVSLRISMVNETEAEHVSTVSSFAPVKMRINLYILAYVKLHYVQRMYFLLHCRRGISFFFISYIQRQQHQCVSFFSVFVRYNLLGF